MCQVHSLQPFLAPHSSNSPAMATMSSLCVGRYIEVQEAGALDSRLQAPAYPRGPSAIREGRDGEMAEADLVSLWLVWGLVKCP